MWMRPLALLAVLLFPPLARAQTLPDAEVEASALMSGLDEAPAAAPADLPERVDLSEQFWPRMRDQKGLNSCHAFATVALLEAAYYRRTGRRIRLSEADLFVRVVLRHPRVLRAHEGGLLREDLRVALAEGVMPGDYYAELVPRYHALKNKVLRSRDALEAALLPEGLGQEARASRVATADALAGSVVAGPGAVRFLGSIARTVVKGGSVRCSGRGKRRDLIMRTLASGVPVGAGFLLNGLPPPWDSRRDDIGAPHYFVLTGYERTPEGVRFHTRNSWGDDRADSPDLDEDAMCALFGASWIEDR